ncbi:hypothetical protein RI367_002356 [Sorochytrium milnesiophthora]
MAESSKPQYMPTLVFAFLNQAKETHHTLSLILSTSIGTIAFTIFYIMASLSKWLSIISFTHFSSLFLASAQHCLSVVVGLLCWVAMGHMEDLAYSAHFNAEARKSEKRELLERRAQHLASRQASINNLAPSQNGLLPSPSKLSTPTELDGFVSLSRTDLTSTSYSRHVLQTQEMSPSVQSTPPDSMPPSPTASGRFSPGYMLTSTGSSPEARSQRSHDNALLQTPSFVFNNRTKLTAQAQNFTSALSMTGRPTTGLAPELGASPPTILASSYSINPFERSDYPTIAITNDNTSQSSYDSTSSRAQAGLSSGSDNADGSNDYGLQRPDSAQKFGEKAISLRTMSSTSRDDLLPKNVPM